MDYIEYLLHPASRLYIDKLAEIIIGNPEEFEQLYWTMFHPDPKVSWKAAWACEKISEKFSSWFTPGKQAEIIQLAIETKHSGLRRGCLSILMNLPLPEPIPVDFINACFEWMVSPGSAIAVQALSMKMLYRVCEKEPDFKQEFQLYLETINPGDYSKGVMSVKKHMLKKLQPK
ncbi:MAG TPA: hypothetical protein VK152_02550 [Paludibacter sp.]|nr:hypothetical protein [Paludibacter sp.]